MDKEIIEHINELFDSYDLFSGTGRKKVSDSIKRRFPNIAKERIKELEDYLDEFYKYCVEYADVIANKYKTPFLPKYEEAQKEIAEYVRECKKQYPQFDEQKVIGIFSTVCWLANR